MKFLAFILVSLIPILSAHAAERPIPVPHDPDAQHALVIKSGSATQRVVITRRESLLGVIYSKRIYDCEKQTVNLVGTGATLDILEKAHAVSGMGPVIRDSTSEYIQTEACS